MIADLQRMRDTERSQEIRNAYEAAIDRLEAVAYRLSSASATHHRAAAQAWRAGARAATRAAAGNSPCGGKGKVRAALAMGGPR